MKIKQLTRLANIGIVLATLFLALNIYEVVNNALDFYQFSKNQYRYNDFYYAYEEDDYSRLAVYALTVYPTMDESANYANFVYFGLYYNELTDYHMAYTLNQDTSLHLKKLEEYRSKIDWPLLLDSIESLNQQYEFNG